MEAESTNQAVRWVLIAVAALAIVLLLAYARREPGFDERVPDPEDAVGALVLAGASDGGV